MSRITQTKRGSIGFQYNPQRCNDIRKVQGVRNTPTVMTESYRDMDGQGIMDIARSIFEKGKALTNNISDAYTSEIGTAIRNALPDSDDTARPGFAGERHVILKLKNGKNGVANYMGPDTALMKRLARNDPGRTAVDEVSKAHDIRYALANNLRDVRKADNIMIDAVKGIERNRGDNPRNIMLAKAITAKKFAEDIGVLKKDAFSGDLNQASDKDIITLKSNLNGLAQKGYGISLAGGAMLPGDALRAKLIKQIAHRRQTKKKKGISSSKTFAGIKIYKMIGSGAMSGKGDEFNY